MQKTWVDLIGPFSLRASVCQCVIFLEQSPNHFKVLWKFENPAECIVAFEAWRNVGGQFCGGLGI